MADHIYLKGLHYNNISYFALAKYFFPFEKELLTVEGVTLIRSQINNEHTYKAIKEALKYDPYSIELLVMFVQYENHFGTKEKAKRAFDTLKQIGLNTNSFKKLQQLDTMKGF